MPSTHFLRQLRGLAVVLSLPLALLPGCAKEASEAPPATQAAPPTTSYTPAPAAVQVTDVQVGNAVGSDKRVTAPTDTFQSTDTIYVSVITSGSAASASLTARFTYQDGQVVDESSQTIAPTGSDATEFHISKPDGWPAGDYQVEILLDGQSVSTESFRVQ